MFRDYNQQIYTTFYAQRHTREMEWLWIVTIKPTTVEVAVAAATIKMRMRIWIMGKVQCLETFLLLYSFSHFSFCIFCRQNGRFFLAPKHICLHFECCFFFLFSRFCMYLYVCLFESLAVAVQLHSPEFPEIYKSKWRDEIINVHTLRVCMCMYTIRTITKQNKVRKDDDVQVEYKQQ